MRRTRRQSGGLFSRRTRKHGGTKRRVWRKIPIGIERSLEIRAAEFTTSDLGDVPHAARVAGPDPAANLTGILGKIGELLGGYSSGGYTGTGGTYEPKGIVHGGEYVMSKAAVQTIGVGNLDAMHRAAKAGQPVAVPEAKAAAAMNAKIVNVFDPADVLDAALTSTHGEKVFLNYMTRNARRLGVALGR